VHDGPHFLQLSRVRDAVVVARPELDDWSGGAGVLRRQGDHLEYVKGSGVSRYGRRQIPVPEPSGWTVGHHIDSAVYAGFLYDHYGHFLLESLARLWTPEPCPEVPVVWIAGWTETLSSWMTEVLDLIGAPPDRRIVTSGSGALEVGELIVPDAGFEFGRFMHPWLARRLARYDHDCANHPRGQGVAASAGSHVWLSRSARAPISGLDEEIEVEQHLRARGWTVLRPEEFSLRRQVEMLADAVHVAGLEGSAFHTLALLRDQRAAVDLFTRQEHINFELVAAAAGIDQRRHRLPGATPRERKKSRGVDVQWSGVDIDALLGILESTCQRHDHEPVHR
jgi:capsular polysaccharide biosynthesis protein